MDPQEGNTAFAENEGCSVCHNSLPERIQELSACQHYDLPCSVARMELRAPNVDKVDAAVNHLLKTCFKHLVQLLKGSGRPKR